MADQNNPADAFAGARDIGASDGDANAADSNNNLTLVELNTLLGKDFKDKDSALKSLKDTQTYAATTATEKANLEARLKNSSTDSERLKKIETDLFYTNNPEYKPYRDTLEAMGGNPEETVQKDAFKRIFADLSEFEKDKQKKSVLVSNPRIGQAKTRMDEAKDLSARGRQAEAGALATAAVLDAYDKQ